jgi:hypothetical protein
MTPPPDERWQPQQPWGVTPADQGQPYGEPFDSSVSNPHQQPPPPRWDQGTWTQRAQPAARKRAGRMSLLIAFVLLLVIALVVGVVLL